MAHRLENLTRNELKSVDNQIIYHVGIIDYLQFWSSRKRCENYLKTEVLMQKEEHISCISPHKYQFRFMNFIGKHIVSGSSRLDSKAGRIDLRRMHAEVVEHMLKLG